jgi:ArsR family transcriptional regulator, arsenate/arsenite/antimonite-responsive transcriptional repressor
MTINSIEFAKAIADETRQKIMNLLCCRWLSVSEVVEELGQVSQPTVSHHLSILKEAGLVKVRPEGKLTYYTLDQDQMASCCGRLIRVFAPESGAARSMGEDQTKPNLHTNTKTDTDLGNHRRIL